MRISKAIATGLLAVTVAFGAVACGGGKPSKDAVRDAIMSEMQQQEMSGESKEMAEKMVDCMVDDAYPKLSDEGAKAIAEKDKDHKPSDADKKALEDATAKCTEEMMKDLKTN